MSLLTSAEHEEWLELVAPPHDGVLVAIKVAFDESGTHGTSHFTMAAIVGKQMHWTQVQREWGPIAATYPKGYHATSAKDSDNATLAAILNRWLYGYTFSIAYADFAHIPGAVRSEFGSIYVTALRALTLFLKGNAERNGEITQAFVLESGHKEESSAHKYLSELITNRGDFRVYSQLWVGKHEIITHPADLAAFVMGSAHTKHPSPLLPVVAESVQAITFPRHRRRKRGTAICRRQC